MSEILNRLQVFNVFGNETGVIKITMPLQLINN